MKDRIAIIDADPLIHIVANVQYSAGNRAITGNVVEHAKRMLLNILSTADSTHYVIFYQMEGHKNYRNKFLPSYKQHRVSSEAIELFKPVIINFLENFPGTYGLMNIESDDAIAIYAKSLVKPYIIVENDKDMWCIPGIHFNPYKKGLTADLQWYNISDTTAELVKWSQILSGDGTDASLDDAGIKGLGAGKPDKNNKWKPGKAMNMLMPLAPNMYRARVAEEYMSRFGVIEGLNRMALTYSLIHILDEPEKDIKESLLIPSISATARQSSIDKLFD